MTWTVAIVLDGRCDEPGDHEGFVLGGQAFASTLVTFMRYDSRYVDDETCRLESMGDCGESRIANPSR